MGAWTAGKDRHFTALFPYAAWNVCKAIRSLICKSSRELLTGAVSLKTYIESCKVVQSEDVTSFSIKIAIDNNNFTIFNFACILVDLRCRVTSIENLY